MAASTAKEEQKDRRKLKTRMQIKTHRQTLAVSCSLYGQHALAQPDRSVQETGWHAAVGTEVHAGVQALACAVTIPFCTVWADHDLNPLAAPSSSKRHCHAWYSWSKLVTVV